MPELKHFDIIRERWGEEVAREVLLAQKTYLPLDDYLNKYCKTCGGNWGGWFLSGVKELWPLVWDAIPENMGENCFETIMHLLACLGIWWEGQND